MELIFAILVVCCAFAFVGIMSSDNIMGSYHGAVPEITPKEIPKIKEKTFSAEEANKRYCEKLNSFKLTKEQCEPYISEVYEKINNAISAGNKDTTFIISGFSYHNFKYSSASRNIKKKEVPWVIKRVTDSLTEKKL